MRLNLVMNYPTGYPALLKKLPFVILTAFVTVVGINNVNAATQAAPNTEKKTEKKVEKKVEKFSHDTVITLAEQLSQTPFKEAKKAPKELIDLNFDTYSKINYQENAAIWGGSPTKFSVQLFAPGFLYKNLVDIDVVENSKAIPIELTEASFDVPNDAIEKLITQVGQYAGVRLHYPINDDETKDEFIMFQGASYFRVLSKGQTYGLSNRGLAIDVAQPKGEEYPLFKRFWVERPSKYQTAIVVHALLDSQSVTGAYRFGIYPGSPSRVEVEVTLFPRRDIPHVGLAPLTSMFLYGGLDSSDKPDYRPQVHNSDGLQVDRGNGERLWRPLNNPNKLQISAFGDEDIKGFGLIQRHRKFEDYQDLDANYQLKPSAWIEPLNDWGKGQLILLEIPSNAETNDNIVTYWEPQGGLKKDQPYKYSYRMTASNDSPSAASKARVVRSSKGQLVAKGKELLIDYSNINAQDIDKIRIDASISKGKIISSRIVAHPDINGARVFLNFEPESTNVAELRVQLNKGDKPLAATWLYRWNSDDWQ
ncbi:glucan biosynthesis protein G [Shewanella morhuae]|uniref:Glucans biosynthesis protein G n=1 Tax=Shewanella morhuae TaxID=365591 RepID=A0A379ZNT3_9GAMM|nr:glucan biosynthesis protein G [Shewanella morhuae]SUI65470.1 Glucans biosynthesis protein G precursor [Shewanella morhuae]